MDLSFGFVFEKERLSKSYSITKSNSYEEEPPKPEKPEMLSEEIKSIFGQGKFKVKEKIDFYLLGMMTALIMEMLALQGWG